MAAKAWPCHARCDPHLAAEAIGTAGRRPLRGSRGGALVDGDAAVRRRPAGPGRHPGARGQQKLPQAGRDLRRATEDRLVRRTRLPRRGRQRGGPGRGMGNPDSAVVVAAAKALGKIATPEAARPSTPHAEKRRASRGCGSTIHSCCRPTNCSRPRRRARRRPSTATSASPRNRDQSAWRPSRDCCRQVKLFPGAHAPGCCMPPLPGQMRSERTSTPLMGKRIWSHRFATG